jgi:hypothetical protein
MITRAHGRRTVAALSLVASLALAPSTLASGGGGGGTGGGGGGGGGGVSAPASASCAQITGFSNTTSYNWGDLSRIDTPYSISSSCATWVTADVTYTNQLTGNVDFERSAVILPGSAIGSFAFAPAPFSTPYTVTLSVQDWSFNTLASRSASITTKKPQQGSL